MNTLKPVTRPDGRTYQPRKVPAAVVVHDHHEDPAWIYVLRTHDLDLARAIAGELAEREGLELLDAQAWRDWIHNGMDRGERFYFSNPVRGVPTVIFRLDT